MVRILRDISELSPKKRKIAGIVNTIIGAAVIIGMNWFDGTSLETSVIQIGVSLVVGAIAVML